LITTNLPKGQKYDQDYFISDILPELEWEKNEQKKQSGTFYVQVDHSKSHDGWKIQEKFEMKGFVGPLHPPYSS
jgi:hypothetical protein